MRSAPAGVGVHEGRYARVGVSGKGPIGTILDHDAHSSRAVRRGLASGRRAQLSGTDFRASRDRSVHTRPNTQKAIFAAALRLALEEVRGLPASFDDPAAAADAEILLLRIQRSLGNDPAGALEALNACRAGGWLGSRVAFARHAALSDLARFGDAEAEAEKHGFITKFLLAGPFDNERGAGQSVALAPEQGPVDPDAAFEGKDRQVRWRPLASLPAAPSLDLADLIVPKEQVLAYLACTITSPTDQVVALGIGHSSFCRVWLDGALVYEREVQRDDAVPDQEHVPIRLRAGPNELLVKTGVVTGPFRIALRIAAADGGPPPAGIVDRGARPNRSRGAAPNRVRTRGPPMTTDRRARSMVEARRRRTTRRAEDARPLGAPAAPAAARRPRAPGGPGVHRARRRGRAEGPRRCARPTPAR